MLPVPSQFLLVEPADLEPNEGLDDARALGWGLESDAEAIVYFKHPRQEIREVAVFGSAEQAQVYYSRWGWLDLVRPDTGCTWPADPPSTLPDDECADSVAPIWQAGQRPGAQLTYLYRND